MADRAERAVEDFFGHYSLFGSAEAIHKYVNWAAPPARAITDSTGRRLLVEDHVFPYMYRYNNKDPMPESIGVGDLLFT
jgi:hypothetical protein